MESGISRPKSREGTWLWMIKVITGPLIVIILLIHFVVNHLIAPGGLLTYADVIAYYRIPIVPIMEIFFVIMAVVHSLLGIRSILLDLNPSAGLVRVADLFSVMLGAASIGYGIWLILLLVSRGAV